MLNRIKPRLAAHVQAATNSFNYLSQNLLSTFVTVVVIASALTLPALFWVFNNNMALMMQDWHKNGHISLYLKTGLSTDEQQVLLTKIRSMKDVQTATLQSREESLKELQQQEGMQDIMRYLPENPLPAVVDIIPVSLLDTPQKMDPLYQQLKLLPEVSQARLDLEWILRMHAILEFVNKLTHVILALLALVVIVIVGFTLRLTIHNRHEEVQVLKLIGATDAFILRPFLYSGVWYGMIGAVFAVLFVNIFMLGVAHAFHNLADIYQVSFSPGGLTVRQAYGIVFAAICLGWIGARFSARRQMTSIEPYS